MTKGVAKTAATEHELETTGGREVSHNPPGPQEDYADKYTGEETYVDRERAPG